MESRKITIVETKRQKKSVIMSNAVTLGELKEDMRKEGIDYTDQLFYEAITKTQLLNDESVLPKDVLFKGNTTNELIFRLTNVENKTKSGADKAADVYSLKRTEVYSEIKRLHLEAECKDQLGKNFTMCKTSDLQNIIYAKLHNAEASEDKPTSPILEKEEKPVVVHADDTAFKNKLAEILTKLVDVLYNNDLIDEDEQGDFEDDIADAVATDAVVESEKDEEPKSEKPKKPELESSYSDDEIDDLCDF